MFKNRSLARLFSFGASQCDADNGSATAIDDTAASIADEDAAIVAKEPEIPFAHIDLAQVANPIPVILASPEFDPADRYFVASEANKRSLVPARSHVVMHALVRNHRPTQVFEIGTYHGGTTEVLARAVVANGGGTVHTVGPFDEEAFRPVYDSWPQQLRETVRFYPTDSMAFFMEMDRQNVRPDLVFVDGDHSYEFTLFDIQCAARRLAAGGFLIIDDSIQAGPFFAAQDFLSANPDWIDCAAPEPGLVDPTLAFDRNRTPIPGTSLIVLRAPNSYRLAGSRPRTFGEVYWDKPDVHGVRIALDGVQGPGALHVQCVMTGFGNASPPEQIMATGSTAIEPGARAVEIPLSPVMSMQPARDRHTLETWVAWIGAGTVSLDAIPDPY